MARRGFWLVDGVVIQNTLAPLQWGGVGGKVGGGVGEKEPQVQQGRQRGTASSARALEHARGTCRIQEAQRWWGGGGHAAWKDLAVDATRPWRTQTSQNIPCGVKTTHSGTFALILPSLTTS